MSKMIDIREFRSELAEAPALKFATSGDPVATDDDRTFTFVFSDESVDRYGDVIFARGWDVANFNENPIALFGHDANTVEHVVGRAKNVRVEGTRLIGDIEFMDAETNPKAAIVCEMVRKKFLRTVSVGFQPKEWELAKDKNRPGGVNFKKQELLEISIVPIPANPNALVQAKAAGIDVDRLGLTVEPVERTAGPKIQKKGLYSVSFLASILADLGYLQDSVAWEAEHEGDNSPIPQALLDAMKQLGQVLIDMTAEEVAELLGGDDEDDLGTAIGLSASGQRASLARSLVKLDAGLIGGLASVARDLAAGRVVHVKTAEAPAFTPIAKSGKAISAANEKCLRAAHEHVTAAANAIMSVVEPPEEDDDPESGDEDAEKAAADLRRRKAVARQRALANQAP
jgi:HK97 family phage prohead protease